MNKPKVMLKARGAVLPSTDHLRLYGMAQGVDTSNKIILDLIDWAYDMGHGDDRPCPVNEKEIKRRVKW